MPLQSWEAALRVVGGVAHIRRAAIEIQHARAVGGIAAPGENIASVNNSGDGALANGSPDAHQKPVALSGTSYAAGYISGVAALVRNCYPGLNVIEVVRRLTTAHRGARESSNTSAPAT